MIWIAAETLINNMQRLGHTPTEIMKQLMQNLQLDRERSESQICQLDSPSTHRKRSIRK